MAASTQIVKWPVRQARFVGALVLAVAVVGVTPDALAQTGTVSGRVTNAATGAGVLNVLVTFCLGPTCVSQFTNASGAYTVTAPAGTHVAFTQAPADLVDEIFDDIPCPMSCSRSSAAELGAPVVVAAGSVTSGVNFALRPAGTITGRVTDAATGAPLAGVPVLLATRFGSNVFIDDVTSTASGGFTFTGLGPATYAAYTRDLSPTTTHANMIFRDLLCLATCNDFVALESGTPIVVTPGATTGGIDFALPSGGTIAGRVVSSATAAPLPDVLVSAFTRTGAGIVRVKAASADASGFYTLTGLPPGAYVVRADSSRAGAISEVHDNHPCVAMCTEPEIGAGTPVTVAAGATATVDFRLDPGGSISGTLTDATTLTPVRGTVQVYRLEGTGARLAAAAVSRSTGTFFISGLNTGRYVALVEAGGFAPALFNGVRCEPCSNDRIATGTPIVVTNGATTPGINIALTPAGAVGGTLRAAATNVPIAGAVVHVFRAGSSSPIASALTNAAGVYTAAGLLPGTVLVATDAPGFADQVFDGVVCPGGTCAGSPALLLGNRIAVAPGATVTGLDFSLGRTNEPPTAPRDLRVVQGAGGVRFEWGAPSAGALPTSYVLEAGLTSGTTFAAVPVAGLSFTVPGMPAGTFFLRVRAINAAGSGPASPELRVRVGAGGVILPEAPVNLETTVVAGRLTMTWSAALAGAPATNYLVEVGSGAGLANLAVVPVATRSFTFSGVPPGFYYFRVRAQNAGGTSEPGEEQLVVAGSVAAPPSAIPRVASTVAGNVLTLTWEPPAFGPVTSYRVEAGSAPGLANLAVLDTGSNVTSLVVPGVPPGSYYVRLRAVNALGASPVSDERVIVVP